MSARRLHLRLAGATLLAVALALLGAQATAATAAAPAASAASAAASSAVAAAIPAVTDAGPSLRHDPFRRPQIGPNGVVVVREPAEGRESAPPVIEPPWQPDLRGVMLAGADSIANVDGTVLRIGEAIDGWRLVRVDDGRATFAKAGRQTTLSMNNAGQARR